MSFYSSVLYTEPMQSFKEFMDIPNFSQWHLNSQQQALDILKKAALTASMFKREAQSTLHFFFIEMFEHSLNQFIIQNSPRSQL